MKAIIKTTTKTVVVLPNQQEIEFVDTASRTALQWAEMYVEDYNKRSQVALAVELENADRVPFHCMSVKAKDYMKAHAEDVQCLFGDEWRAADLASEYWEVDAYRINPTRLPKASTPAKTKKLAATPKVKLPLTMELENADKRPFYSLSPRAKRYMKDHAEDVQGLSGGKWYKTDIPPQHWKGFCYRINPARLPKAPTPAMPAKTKKSAVKKAAKPTSFQNELLNDDKVAFRDMSVKAQAYMIAHAEDVEFVGGGGWKSVRVSSAYWCANTYRIKPSAIGKAK